MNQGGEEPIPTVDHFAEPTGTQAPGAALQSTISYGPPEPFSNDRSLCVPGYSILGEIARGGMGVVLAARDQVLDRDVAIKVLRGVRASDKAAARFVRESRLTARLPHPGVPPVHALGTLPDGSPFLAMKLIRGRTLAQLLAERASPTGDLARFVQIFEQIAQTVGFAHSRRIIHRDLKPLNVMVGEFGEVQVMDWGLARELRDAEAGPDDGPGNESPSGDATQIGAILGTPAYMSPEQARGEPVDARSDVFGLGAILTEMLTGRTPWGKAAPNLVVARAGRGELDACLAALDECGADGELIALARRCLAAQREDRPPDGKAVADVVADYRRGVEDRLRRAETERAAATVQAAEQRKRRRLLLFASGALVGVLTLGIGGTTWGLFLARHNAELEREAAGREKLARTAAEADRDRARQRFQLALDAFNDLVFSVQNKLQRRPSTQDLRVDLLEHAHRGLQKLLREAELQGSPDHTLLWCYLHMGDVETVLGNTLAAEQQYQLGYELAQRLAAAAPDQPELQRDLGVSLTRCGDIRVRRGGTRDGLDFYQKALTVKQRLVEADPENAQLQRDVSMHFNKLGDVTLQLGRTNDALDFFQQAYELDLRRIHVAPEDPETQRDLSISIERLGDVTLQLGKTTDALGFYREMNRFKKRLADADPRNTQAQHDLSISFHKLGDVTLKQGDTREALDFYQQSTQVCERLAQTDPKNAEVQRDLGLSFLSLGDMTLRVGRTRDALGVYQKGLHVCERVADADPGNADVQRNLSICFHKLADVSARLGDTKNAVELHQKALQIRQRLAEADPDSAQAQHDLSYSFTNLGDLSLAQGRTKDALDYYRKAQALQQRLSDADPNNAELQRNWSSTLASMGDVSRTLGRTKEALEAYQQAYALDQRRADADADNAQAQRDLSIGLYRLGDLAMQGGETGEALVYYQKGLQNNQRLADRDPKNTQAQGDLSISFERLGSLALQMGRTQEAREFYEKGLQIDQRLAAADPTNARAQRSLLISCFKLGKVEQQELEFGAAIAWYEKGLRVAREFEQPEFFATELKVLTDRVTECQTAEKAVAEVAFALRQPATEVPGLLELRVRSLVKRQQSVAAIATADRFAEWAEKQDKERSACRYRAARCFACCVAQAGQEKDALAAKIIDLLRKARADGYFTAPRIAAFHKDSDFAVLREQSAFAEFASELERPPG